MRFWIAWVIFRKELVETLRDRRSLFMLVGLPMLLYPVMLIGLSKVAERQTASLDARVATIAVWGAAAPEDLPWGEVTAGAGVVVERDRGLPPELAARLAAGDVGPRPPRPKARSRAAGGRSPPSGAPPASDEPGPRDPADEVDGPVVLAARAAIAAGEVDAVLVVWDDLAAARAGDGLARVAIYHDPVVPRSLRACQDLEDALERWREGALRERLARRGLPEGFARLVDVDRRDVAPPARRTGQFLGLTLPFVLIVMSLMGGFYAAIDVTAGEKERGTMQTLLCAPIRPGEVILGKFGCVWALTILGGLANVASLGLTLWRVLPGDRIELDLRVLPLVFLLFLPVSMLTSAAFLLVSAFAKDFKDGQNFITPVYLLLSMPAGFTMVPGVELGPGTALVPVLNVALLIKALLVGDATGEQAFLVLGSSCAWGALVLALAAQVFGREQVLLGGPEPLRESLGLGRRPGDVPTPALALVVFAATLVAAFYGSLALEGRGLVGTLLLTQLGFFLAPVLAATWALRLDPRRTLLLGRPPARGLAGATLVGLSAWTIVLALTSRMAPPPEELVRAMEKALGDPSIPLPLALLVVAVLPGVCEEVLFRGFVLAGLGRLGRWPGLVLTALLFGLAHASLYRFLPTATLGLLFGWLALRTGSVACSALAHALNNAVALLLLRVPGLAPALGIDPTSGALPWPLVLGAAVVLVVGLRLAAVPPARLEPAP